MGSRRYGLAWGAIALSCSACGQQSNLAENREIDSGSVPTPAPPSPARVATTLYLAEDGIELFDRARRRSRLIRFGTEEAQALALIEPLTGPLEMGSVTPDCRIQPNAQNYYRSNLTLVFERGRFVAWRMDGPGGGFATRQGIAVGITREALRALVPTILRPIKSPDSMEEFAAGPLHGVLHHGRVLNFGAGRSVC